MSDYGQSLDNILDGLTMPQFRLLSKLRVRRIVENRRWDLELVKFSLQSEEQVEIWQNMMESLSDLEAGTDSMADMGGGVFTVSKRYPLLHELTPAQVKADPKLRKIIKFRTVKEEQ